MVSQPHAWWEWVSWASTVVAPIIGLVAPVVTYLIFKGGNAAREADRELDLRKASHGQRAEAYMAFVQAAHAVQVAWSNSTSDILTKTMFRERNPLQRFPDYGEAIETMEGTMPAMQLYAPRATMEAAVEFHRLARATMYQEEATDMGRCWLEAIKAYADLIALMQYDLGLLREPGAPAEIGIIFSDDPG